MPRRSTPFHLLRARINPETQRTYIEDAIVNAGMTRNGGQPNLAELNRRLREQEIPFLSGRTALGAYLRRVRAPDPRNARIISNFLGLPFETAWEQEKWVRIE